MALLQYVYNERKVGQAYLLDKTIQVPAETEPSGGDAAEPGTEDGSGETGSAAQEPEDTEEPTETASVEPEKTDGRFSMKLPKAVIPGVILAVLAALGPVSGWSGSGREGKKRRRQPPGDGNAAGKD